MPHPKKRKYQIRRCRECGAAGHNLSTCAAAMAPASVISRRLADAPVAPPAKISPPTPLPIPAPPPKFFIHHVPQAAARSAHIVNLKPAASAWADIAATAPDTDNITAYQHYHQPPQAAVAPPALSLNDFPAILRRSLVKQLLKLGRDFFNQLPRRLASARPIEPNLKPTPPSQKLTPAFQSLWARLLTRSNTIKIFPPLRIFRLAPLLIILLFILVIPRQAESYYGVVKTSAQTVVAQGQQGFSALAESLAALRQADLSTAAALNQRALTEFGSALTTATAHPLLTNLASVLPKIGKKLASAQQLLLAGQALAIGNAELITALTAAAVVSDPWLAKIETISAGSRLALPYLARARSALAAVDPTALSLEQSQSLRTYEHLLSGAEADLATFGELSQLAQEAFGGNGRRRYLVVFQNPAELRPTGGFAGSFGILEVNNGVLESFTVPPGGSYDLAGQLDEHVEPPEPLLLVNRRWEFQDANWFPDFPESAKKFLWFYRHARGTTLDGVIAINAPVLTRLLSVLGPISTGPTGTIFTAAGVLPELQTIIENKRDHGSSAPKQIITDLAPLVLQKISAPLTGTLPALVLIMEQSLLFKDLQLYFTDPALETTVRSFAWGGAVADTNADSDYLMVVTSNLGGQKSDAEINQAVSHQAEIQPDGTVINTVTIRREHIGIATGPSERAINSSYLRLYVPLGSELISAVGFSVPAENSFRAPAPWAKPDSDLKALEHQIGIDPASGTKLSEEFGKTVFGNWLMTAPGVVSEVRFTYRLPFAFRALANRPGTLASLFGASRSVPYQLMIQRQSGAVSSFESQVIFPTGWTPRWSRGPGITSASNGFAVEPQELKYDSVWSALMVPTNN